MFNEVNRVKERRRERIDKIRMQARDAFPPYASDLHDPIEDSYQTSMFRLDRHEDEQIPPLKKRELFGIQIIASIILVGFAYLLLQSSIALPASWKETAREVMSRDFNFKGVAAWYESRFGSLPSVLPALSSKQQQGQENPVATPLVWQTPTSWKLVRPFDHLTNQVIMDAGQANVRNGETGWVTFVGEKPDLGYTVIVQYANNREAWYANLAKPTVAVNDWVKSGDSLGIAKAEGESKPFILMMKDHDQFIDPLDVITLE